MTEPAIDVSYVANLARIDLTPEERELFQKQVSDVLAYVEQLEKIDISAVPDTPIDPHLPTNALRADEIRPSLSSEDALANTPEQKNNLFSTPKIVE